MSQQQSHPPAQATIQQIPLSNEKKSSLTKVGFIGVGVLLLGVLLLPSLGAFAVLLIVAGAASFYFIPSIIAVSRNHASKGGIIIVNILFGWTFLGWILSFAWSVSNANNAQPQQVVIYNNVPAAPTPPSPTTAPPQTPPQIGDVVNGHRFDGQQWVPVATGSSK